MRATVLTLLAAVLLAACGSSPRGRVLVLGLDGLDPDAVQRLCAEGRLPHLERLRREGASGRLTAVGEPLLSPVLWTTIATGRPPDDHGVNHFVSLDPRTGERVPVTSALRRVRAVWEIASEQGRRVGVVGWWASWPADEVDGAIVSDRVCYHFLFRRAAHGGPEDEGLTWPPGLAAEVLPLVKRPSDIGAAELTRYLKVSAEELSRPFDFQDPVGHFRWALASAESYRRIGLQLWQQRRPDLMMVYVEAVDSASHLYGHLFRARGLAGELAEQQARFGAAVEEMYRYADALVGEYLSALDSGTTLVVLSDHGFELGALPDDPRITRDLRRVSERHHKPEGVLYLHGRGVRPGARLQGADQLDVTPTILALLGLGKARDMPGRVLSDALLLAAPPAVATYELQPRRRAPGGAGSEADPQLLAHLRSLGYLASGETPEARRVVADRHFSEGRLEEAEAVYAELIRSQPKEASLRASRAGALAGLGRDAEALREIREALGIDPLNAAAYHNRGAIYERMGRRREALEDYRRALLYRPGYAPSQQALERLVGDPPPAASAGERTALELSERAKDAARRGDYPGAMRLLAEAEQAAPRLALVHQYKANVAYLMQDRRAALVALRRALELDPDNQLLRANLKVLEAEQAPRR